jgi:hypothetical protein
MVNWHSIDEEAVLKELRTGKDNGLPEEEAGKRLKFLPSWPHSGWKGGSSSSRERERGSDSVNGYQPTSMVTVMRLSSAGSLREE